MSSPAIAGGGCAAAEPDDRSARLGGHALPSSPPRFASASPRSHPCRAQRRGARRLQLRRCVAGRPVAERAALQRSPERGSELLGRHRPAGAERRSSADRPGRPHRGPEARPARRPGDPRPDPVGRCGWTARDAHDRLHQRRRTLLRPRFDRRRGGSRHQDLRHHAARGTRSGGRGLHRDRQSKRAIVELGELAPGTYTISDTTGGAAPISITVA